MSDSATSSFIDDHTPIITDTTTEDISDSSFDDVFSTIPPHLETTSEEIVDQNNESDYPYLTIEQLKYQIEQLEKGMYKKDKIIEQSKHEITQLKEEISEKDNVIMQSDYKIYQLGKKLNETDKITRSLGERLNEQKKLHEDGTSEILKKTPKIIRVKKMSCDALKEVVTLSPQTKPLNVVICRIHWFAIPVTVTINNKKIEIHKPSLKEICVIEGKQITFIQDDFDFIKLKNTNNESDRLCVVDLTYCQGNTIDIHTPNGVLLKHKQECENGTILTMDGIISENVNGKWEKRKFYVSFVKSYIKQIGSNTQNVFGYDDFPINKNGITRQCISYNIIIPSGYDKDVYYYEQQNRQQLFGFSNFNKIPVYFPIPVLKDKNNYSVVFEIYPQNYARRYIRICVTANGPKETKEE